MLIIKYTAYVFHRLRYEKASAEANRKRSFQCLTMMPSRILFYLNIAKGERDSKVETKFTRFDMVEPLPIFYKYTESR